MMDMLVPGRVPTSSAKHKPFGETFDGDDCLRKKKQVSPFNSSPKVPFTPLEPGKKPGLTFH